MAKATALTPSQIKHVFTVTELMTHSEAKRCALEFSFAAMRVAEIALLDTKTILYPSGYIRTEIVILKLASPSLFTILIVTYKSAKLL